MGCAPSMKVAHTEENNSKSHKDVSKHPKGGGGGGGRARGKDDGDAQRRCSEDANVEIISRNPLTVRSGQTVIASTDSDGYNVRSSLTVSNIGCNALKSILIFPKVGIAYT